MTRALAKTTPDPTPALIEKARELLASAQTLDEILHVRGIAGAAEKFFKAARNSRATAQRASELRYRAERKAGHKLIEMRQTGERAGHGGDRKSKAHREPLILRHLGIERNQATRWQQIARIPDEVFEAYIAEALADEFNELATVDLLRLVRDNKRDAKRRANRKLVEEAEGPLETVTPGIYSAIVIDPPWDWGDEGDVDQFARARPTYETRPFEEILELPVAELAAPNAHLYLWITNRSLPKGFDLLEAWDFRYITLLTWCKPSIGMGNYFRGSTEHLLFGVRGSLELLERDQGTYFMADRPAGEHSTKPPELYELVERCSPGPWLEMFARNPRKGWTVWGAEVEP